MADIPADIDPVTYLASQNKPFLKRFLQQCGITIGDKGKDELLDLCIRAHTFGLPQERVEEDENKQAEWARTVHGQTLPHPSSLQSPWQTDLRSLALTFLVDIITYLRTKCGWTDGRLKRYKDDRGYLLHRSGHVTGVKLNTHDGCTYVRGQCTPQTRLSAQPYEPWILLTADGDVVTEECT